MGRSSAKRSVVERCWVLLGRRQGSFWYARRQRPTSGQLAGVEFDPTWVLNREETKGDVIGFYHTHPNGSPNLSRRDVKTMRAWVKSFGRPLLCIIESSNQLTAFCFDNDHSRGRSLTACELFPRGVVIAAEFPPQRSELGQRKSPPQ